MSLVVTGASGHLGRLVVEALLERGTPATEIVATTRDPEALTELTARGVEVRPADFNDPASLRSAFAGARRILLISTTDPERLSGQRNAVEAAKDAGVELLAYTSLPHADTSSLLLAADHRATEELIVSSGLTYAFLRNSWYHENYTEQLGPVLEHKAVLGSAGDGRVSAAARADYAAAAAVVLAGNVAGNQVHELGGDTAYTLTEYAAALSDATGETITYVDQPVAEYQAFLASVGVPAPMDAVLADADRGLSAGELLVETGTLSRLIGRPTTPLADAIAAALPVIAA
ncbi:MAG: SDR family oxidoreductase [Marmoricola sp.]